MWNECEERNNRTLVLDRFDLFQLKSIFSPFILRLWFFSLFFPWSGALRKRISMTIHERFWLNRCDCQAERAPSLASGEGQSKRWQSPGSAPPVALMSLKIHLTPLVWLNYSAWPWAVELILWDFNKQAGEEGQRKRVKQRKRERCVCGNGGHISHVLCVRCVWMTWWNPSSL